MFYNIMINEYIFYFISFNHFKVVLLFNWIIQWWKVPDNEDYPFKVILSDIIISVLIFILILP